eukprot:9856878-Alexandrium_andersonii.AAC.1
MPGQARTDATTSARHGLRRPQTTRRQCVRQVFESGAGWEPTSKVAAQDKNNTPDIRVAGDK